MTVEPRGDNGAMRDFLLKSEKPVDPPKTAKTDGVVLSQGDARTNASAAARQAAKDAHRTLIHPSDTEV